MQFDRHGRLVLGIIPEQLRPQAFVQRQHGRLIHTVHNRRQGRPIISPAATRLEQSHYEGIAPAGGNAFIKALQCRRIKAGEHLRQQQAASGKSPFRSRCCLIPQVIAAGRQLALGDHEPRQDIHFRLGKDSLQLEQCRDLVFRQRAEQVLDAGCERRGLRPRREQFHDQQVSRLSNELLEPRLHVARLREPPAEHLAEITGLGGRSGPAFARVGGSRFEQRLRQPVHAGEPFEVFDALGPC